MNNEKGLTLVELLAAITITSMILGAASLLYFSIIRTANTTTQNYSDHSQMSLTVNTLSKQLTDSTKVVYFPNQNELRYKSGNTYKSLYYNSSNNTLTIYDFGNDGGSGSVDAQFKNGSNSLTSTPGLYSNPLKLSSMVSKITYSHSDDSTEIPAIPLTNGQVIKINVTFNYTFIHANGTKSNTPKTKSIRIKLLLDRT